MRNQLLRSIGRTRIVIWLTALVLAGALTTVNAEGVPSVINYQGRLLDSSGNPQPDGPYTMTFHMYAEATGSKGVNALWGPEGHQGVAVKDGYFSVLLGDPSNVPFSQDLFETNPELYLGISVGEGDPPEMAPRQRIVSVPFAQHSRSSDTVKGPDLFVSDTGNVGIGTTDPDGKLVVEGIPDLGHVTVRSSGRPFLNIEGGTNSLKTLNFCDPDSAGIHGYRWTFNALAGNDGSNPHGFSITSLGMGYDPILTMTHDGWVGIGTSQPQSELDVSGTVYAHTPLEEGNVGVEGHGYETGVHGQGVGYGVIGDGLVGVSGRGTWNGVVGFGGAGHCDFYAGGDGTDFCPFTGAHEVKLSSDFPEHSRRGLIVSATGETQIRRIGEGEMSFSSTLPTVRLSDTGNDKKVLGVLISENPLLEEHWYINESQEEDRFALINAIGEGRVLVTNINGEIETGDYITTSRIPGYGQKQDDDLLHSYTLGKAIENVDWSEVSETIEFGGLTYKVYPIAIVYTSG